MSRVLSIFLALAVVGVLIALIGLFTKTPRFAGIREGIERQVRSTTEPREDAGEPAPVPEA